MAKVAAGVLNAYQKDASETGNVVDVFAKAFSSSALDLEKFTGPKNNHLGIGTNGHIGFNEPGTKFNSQTHIVKLDSQTIKANSRFCANT